MLFAVAAAALQGQGYVMDFQSKIFKGTKINSNIYKDKIANGHSVTVDKFTSSGNLKELR